MKDFGRYAIGQQDFKTLRERDAIYVDKTVFVEKIARSQTQYYFLSRPRRFGKSLFLSTLRYFFEGQRYLFKGLYIDSTDWDWQQYPVLHLDLNRSKYEEKGILDDILENQFREWEKKYDVEVIAEQLSSRFQNIIKAAYEKTGQQVVILVDEYDKPLVGNLHKDEIFEHYRSKLAGIYSNFKSSAEYIRLVFLSGISRFSKLSVFSDLNNLDDISFDDDYADICGITEKELHENLHEGISELALKRKEDFSTTCGRLKQSYDGYRFAPGGSDIYNPWSVLSCLKKGRIGDYWIDTGAPSVIAEALYDADVDIEAILNGEWKLRRLAGLDLRNANPTALLYQAGYLTIGKYDFEYDEVRLKVPNDEVKEGLFNDLLPIYMKGKDGWAEGVVDTMKKAIRNGAPQKMMTCLDAYFAGIPYEMKMDNENNFHNAFYILMTLIGIDAKTEVHTSDGRIDMLIETPKFIYIIELKFDSSPEEALTQINEKEYARKFTPDGRKLFKIGVNFSSEKRRLEDWKIAE